MWGKKGGARLARRNGFKGGNWGRRGGGTDRAFAIVFFGFLVGHCFFFCKYK